MIEDCLIVEIDYRTLPKLSTAYKILEEIGEGNYGYVHSGVRLEDGEMVAIKIPTQQDEHIFREAELMKRVSNHPNSSRFLTYYGLYQHLGKPVIVMEYFPGVKLEASLTGPMNPYQVLDIAKQIFQQLCYLSSLGISHGDLSNDNILIDANGKIQLIDLWWERCPEDEIDLAYDDMYEVGMILIFLLGYDKVSQGKRLQLQLSADQCPIPRLREVINRCVLLHEPDRITVQEALALLG